METDRWLAVSKFRMGVGYFQTFMKRGPGLITWPNLRKSLKSRQSHNFRTINFELTDVCKGMDPYKATIFISRIFRIGDLRSGQFCDLPIMSQNGRKIIYQ